MIFLSLIAVLAIVYWLGSAGIVQYDGWFKWLTNRLQKIPGLSAAPALPLALALIIPLSVLVLLFLVIGQFAGKEWLFFLYVPILLYSLGRGNILTDARDYIALATRGDTVAAAQLLDRLRADTPAADVSDWRGLHTEALRVFAYLGFERMFAVLFWFFIAGPFGALIYRLSVLYRNFSESGGAASVAADKWLWLLELPAVRLMGITWALVGNFETCPLRKNLLDTHSSSQYVLSECLRGALGAPTDRSSAVTDDIKPEEKVAMDEETQDIIEDLTGDVIVAHAEPAYSFALVKSSVPLYSRSLLFWVCVIAFATLVV